MMETTGNGDNPSALDLVETMITVDAAAEDDAIGMAETNQNGNEDKPSASDLVETTTVAAAADTAPAPVSTTRTQRPRRAAFPTKSFAEYLVGDELDPEEVTKKCKQDKQNEYNSKKAKKKKSLPASTETDANGGSREGEDGNNSPRTRTMGTYDFKFGRHLVRNVPNTAAVVTKHYYNTLVKMGGKFKLLKQFITQRRFTPKKSETQRVFQAISVTLQTVPLFNGNKAPSKTALREAIQPIFPAVMSCLLNEAGIEHDVEMLRRALPGNTFIRTHEEKTPMDRATALEILKPFIEPKPVRHYGKKVDGEKTPKRKRDAETSPDVAAMPQDYDEDDVHDADAFMDCAAIDEHLLY